MSGQGQAGRTAPRWLQRALLGCASLGLAWALAVALMAWGQERLLFHPQVLPQDWVFDAGPDVHERWIEVPGGRLHALHLRQPQARGLVFYLHGNAGNLQGWFGGLEPYRRAGLDLFMLDYRGFGKSSCCIRSEAQLHDDVRAAWRAVAPEYAGRTRVLLGDSLGTGLAAALAAEVQPELTVLVAPYRSITALARHHHPWVPPSLLRYPLDTEAVLPRVKTPVLLLHGTHDRLIPIDHSRRLHILAPQAQLVEVPGAGHNDLWRFDAFAAALSAALRAAGNPPARPER